MGHEALIRGWDRLRAWLDEDMEFLLWRQRLGVQLAEWGGTDDEDNILRGWRQLDAEQKLEERLPELTRREVEFIKAGSRIRQREKEDLDQRELAAVAVRKLEQYALELRNSNEQLGRALESSDVEGSSEQAALAEAIISSAEQLDRTSPQLGSDETRALLDALLANAYQFRKFIRGKF